MTHKEIIAQAQTELRESQTAAQYTETTPAQKPVQQPGQVKIEDLADEQIPQVIAQTHAEVGLLCLTERALSQQLNSVRSSLEQLEARNAALYNLAQKRDLQQLPQVQFGPA